MPRKCQNFGVCNEGKTEQVNYLIDEDVGKGANCVLGKGANCVLLYNLLLVQRNCWFANSDVPFSECNKQIATQPICNANVCATSDGCYI